ncbi:arylsulfotransferase family protein [Gimesia algae]|uniref:Arylsulfotransferase (ASST) n=1 Tax=Gimesia algae TaxID=2527971 RepID=A0A517V9Z4_9PLAN|nr:arylsulfotransferase family protein [Gimesia algae]QDT89834.1 Arylsulfotransferase (ASST) [Gimesia algae]
MKFNRDQAIRVLRRLLALFFCLWGLVWLSIRAVEKQPNDRNVLDKGLLAAASVPETVKLWFSVKSTGLEHQEFVMNTEPGLARLGELSDIQYLNNHLYLLYYRYEGTDKGSVYLQNIKTGEVAHTWHVPLRKIFEDIQGLKQDVKADFEAQEISVSLHKRLPNNLAAIRILSPIIGDDLSLIFHCGVLGYMYKLDKKSDLLWKSEELVHHSIELDDDGNIWTCSVDLRHSLAKDLRFREDAVLCLDAEGKRLHFYSLSDMFSNNGLLQTLLEATPATIMPDGPYRDPYHLNNVLPVKSDGKFWRKGDLFLSLRDKSAIVQFRPQDGSIVWYQQGPWLAQHDINIVNESTISVFNNNVSFTSWDWSDIQGGGSNIAFFNFSDKTTEYFGKGLFASKTEGRQTQTVDDWILVEETNKGRYLFIDSFGTVRCQFYIPYHNEPSNAMSPNWARLYLKSGSEFVLQE